MPIQTRADLAAYLDADLRAHRLQRWGLKERLKYPVVAWQRQYRRAEYAANAARGPLGRAWALWLRWRMRQRSLVLGFDIPVNVFGPGLSIAHWGTIIVNGKARVGANCRIHPSTCIGEVKGVAPTIGDNAYIGPGAKVYGGITLGDDVTVGANAVVGRSFPGGVTLAGAPARVINSRPALISGSGT